MLRKLFPLIRTWLQNPAVGQNEKECTRTEEGLRHTDDETNNLSNPPSQPAELVTAAAPVPLTVAKLKQLMKEATAKEKADQGGRRRYAKTSS